jgi:putative DNA primase/helicase
MPLDILREAQHRWFDILTAVGIPSNMLRNRHGPCPMCGGKDRFRWSNKDGNGTWFCNGCGHGDGPDLVMAYKRVDFRGMLDLVKPLIGTSKHRGDQEQSTLSPAERRRRLNEFWQSGAVAKADDPVGLYLRTRLGQFIPSTDLRCVQWSAGATMVAMVRDPKGKPATLHRTFLTLDGHKAHTGESVRKMMPGAVPKGVSVHLMPYQQVLGVAEGIETAIAASILFKVPVWAALNANFLATWQVPDDVETVMVFGDHDANFVGQAAAYEQARRCALARKKVQVHIPDGIGDDWADVLARQLERCQVAA